MAKSAADLFAYIWNLFMGILTFLAPNTALGAWIRDLSSRFGEKLRSWWFKWPEPPASPDLKERREAHTQLLALLSQNRDASYAISQALRDMMGQDAKHHEEILEVLSVSRGILSHISSDAQEIADVSKTLSENVRVVAAFEVDRLLRNLPQSIQETKSEPRARHLRAASA